MQTSARPPSKVVSRQNYFQWPCNISARLPNSVKIPRPSSYDWKVISVAVLTLKFDLDLSKVNSENWRRCWTSVPNFMKIGLVVFDKSRWAWQNNQPTNKLAWSQYLLTPDGWFKCTTRRASTKHAVSTNRLLKGSDGVWVDNSCSFA